MTTVVAAVVRSGRTFLGGTAQTSWVTWGTDVMGCCGPLVTAP
jgi:hypothetical protein